MSEPWEIDVSVLLIFFVREEPFEEVFAAVRKARPRTLLLWQDGPREGRPEDLARGERCRKIAENIDWECTLHQKYHDANRGCDPSTFLAQKWAFSVVDKCIVLEDDRVPDPSFFRYCKELLDRYEQDERISHICGANLLGRYSPCASDYFFASYGSNTWASWRRVAEQWDENYTFLSDEYAMKCLERTVGKRKYRRWYKTAARHRDTGKPHWETILGMGCLLHNQVAVIPKNNLICDRGRTADSTHAGAAAKLVSKVHREMFCMKTYPMPFPMKHPKYIQADAGYETEIDRLSGDGHPFLRVWRTAERVYLYLRHGEWNRLVTGLKRRVK